MREEEAKIEEKERNKEWLRKEREMKDWEHSLEVRERRVGQQDEGSLEEGAEGSSLKEEEQ